jgi:4-amino-4-deoxy-L-arabinose transferase-like glycosyltransferase
MMMGLWFTLFPLIFIPMTLALAATMPHQADFQKVSTQGMQSTGTVDRVETVYNMTINGVHPERVYFRYSDAGEERLTSMDTLSIEDVSGWKAGKQVSIRYLGTEAVIPAVQPVDFPLWLFYFMPFTFVIFGLPFLIYAAFGAIKRHRILKNGMEMSAVLLSLAPVSSLGFSFLMKTRFEAIYSFTGRSGQPVVGKSQTTDLLLLNEKKKGDEIAILALPGTETETQIIDAALAARLRQN